MRLSQMLTESRVIPALVVTTKTDALSRIAEVFARHLEDASSGRVLGVLLEREALGSTGIGGGIAIPHGRLPGLEHPMVVLAICREGVNFDALDGHPVHLIAALLSPEKSGAAHLKALSVISRLLRRESVRAKLLASEDQEQLFQAAIDGSEQ